jgi:hypothetical protein
MAPFPESTTPCASMKSEPRPAVNPFDADARERYDPPRWLSCGADSERVEPCSYAGLCWVSLS